ncbi:PadR family transcriptional regulator [Zavarzinia compransoris]|uniref:PadR family transcriptional regulator n=1 Tax=Zavarzinia marina TaxID=2911065 RepID=UPI001F171487|nr:PadR family transcriptional regulator [Zavarzinia marina]MCF4165260.1 PadR family transcriptional regulator [Zavarzinia marina]
MRFNRESGLCRQDRGRHERGRHDKGCGDSRRFARGRDDFGDHERGGRGRHGGGGRRGRRFFDHGELRLVILGLLAEKPRHGYELIKAIEDAAGGQYSPSPGVVYPTLTLLEEMNQAAIVESEGSRKLYGVTEEGRAQIDANKGAVDALFARMAEAKAIHGDGPPPQIIRAMENLRMALRLKLAAGKPDEEQVRLAAAAIDAAALEIEKL